MQSEPWHALLPLGAALPGLLRHCCFSVALQPRASAIRGPCVAKCCPSVHVHPPVALCAQLGTKETVGYFASWEDWNPGDNALGNLPSYVTTGAQPGARSERWISQASPLS